MSHGKSLGDFEREVLVALVTLGSNSYGMKIRQKIEDNADRHISIGAVYTTLSRLERKGYVSSRVGEPTPERGGRAKKFYKIEALGQQALRQEKDKYGRVYGELLNVGA